MSATTNGGPLHNDEEMSFKEFILKIKEWWRYLLFNWRVILVVGLLGGVCGLIFSISKKPIYTATSTFVLEEDKGGGLGQYAGIASMMGVDLAGGGGGIFQGDNIMELYKSRSMIQKTLLSEVDSNGKERLLIDHYIRFNKLREKWASNKKEPRLKTIHFTPNQGPLSRLQDSVLGEAVKDLNLNYLSVSKPDKKLSIIKVEVKSEDEFFSKSFNDEIVRNVNDFYVQTKTKKSLDNVAILQRKTDSVRAVMNGAIYKAVTISDATPNLNPTKQVQRVAPMQRSQFSAETNKAILGEMVKNLELSKMTLLKETPLIQTVDRPVFPLDKQRLGKAKAIVLGGILFGFVSVLSISIRKFYKNLINE